MAGYSVLSNPPPPKQVHRAIVWRLVVIIRPELFFLGTVDVSADIGTDWETFIKITQPYNTYPCSIISHTKFTLEYMYRCLGVVSYVKTLIQFISDGGFTNYIDPSYRYLLSFNLTPCGYYVAISNGGKEPIYAYGTTLFILWRKIIDKCNVLKIPGLRDPLYSLQQHWKLPNCGYIRYTKCTHMWFLSFYLSVYDRVEKLVTYESMVIIYRISKRYYKQPGYKATTNTYLPTTKTTIISKDEETTDLTILEGLQQEYSTLKLSSTPTSQ